MNSGRYVRRNAQRNLGSFPRLDIADFQYAGLRSENSEDSALAHAPLGRKFCDSEMLHQS